MCQKLRGLSAHHGGRPIEAHVNCSPSHVSVKYLELVPFVQSAVQNDKAPYDINLEMPPSYLDERYSTLEGCRDWNGFDYVLVANGHLERGLRIESWLPEIETDYTYDLQIPADDRATALELAGPRPFLIYMSGVGPNRGFHNHWWSPYEWAQTIKLLNDADIVPHVVGAPSEDDLKYAAWFASQREAQGLRYHNLVGQTTHAQVMAMIQRAAVWVGLNSGLGIASAMMSTPTVMQWSDDREELNLPGVPRYLHHNMQRSWLSEAQLQSYRTLSYGSPEHTPERLVELAMSVMRKGSGV